MDNMTNQYWTTAYCDLNYASTEILPTLKLVYSVSKANSNLNLAVCTVLHSTNRLIAETFIAIVFISKSFFLVITHLSNIE